MPVKKFKLTPELLLKLLYDLHACEVKSYQFVQLFEERGLVLAYKNVVQRAYSMNIKFYTFNGITWSKVDIYKTVFTLLTKRAPVNCPTKEVFKFIEYNSRLWERVLVPTTAKAFLKQFTPQRIERAVLSQARKIAKEQES